jgi:putative flippase GtrA
MFLRLLSYLRRYLVPFKYLLTSVLVYIYILLAIYILVDLMDMDKVLAYIAVYITVYILEYTVTLLLVFNEKHHWTKLFRYMAYVAAFLGLSTMLFKLLISISIHYLIATLLTAMLLMPVRFVVNKYWVYR